MSSFSYSSNKAKFESITNELGLQNFDFIRFASYRTACKLRFIQRRTNFYWVDLWNTIEAIRENGLHAYQQFYAEISYSKLEALISSVYYQLNKRLPPSQHLNIDESIQSLLAFLQATYDPNNVKRYRIFAIKIGLSTLCSGNIVDKMKYIFSLISDLSTGFLIMDRFNEFLRELLALTYPVFEVASYQFTDSLAGLLLDFSHPVDLDAFVDLFLSPTGPPLSLSWYVVLHKIPEVEMVVHETQCSACHQVNFTGFRYKCKNCFNYHLCQDCFWRGRFSGSHRIDSHICKEYTYWKSPTKRIGHTLRKSFRCIPSSKRVHYSEEFPVSNRINLQHIIPSSQMVSERLSGNIAGSNINVNASAMKNDYIPDQFATLGSMSATIRSTTSHHTLPPDCQQYIYTDECENSGSMDEEHRLIARYTARLANVGGNDVVNGSLRKAFADSNRSRTQSVADGNILSSRKQQLIAKLESENREILYEIKRLKEEQNQMLMSTSNYSESSFNRDTQILSELNLLRSRKVEFESHLSQLMDTRRELKSKLEHLVAYLKNQDSYSDPPSAVSTLNQKSNYSTLSLSSSAQDTELQSLLNGADYSHDVMVTADSVTNAISSLMKDVQDYSDTEDYDLIRNMETSLDLKGYSDTDDILCSAVVAVGKAAEHKPYKQLSSRSKRARRHNKLENFQTSWNTNSANIDDEDIYAKTSEDEMDPSRDALELL